MNTIKGGQTLFKEIFHTTNTVVQRRGRSSDLDAERNECLVSSYYYHGLTSGFRYDLMLKVISKMFFISETTVYNLLKENSELLHKVRKDKPTKTDLKKRWPHLSWETPDIKDYI